MAKEPKSSEDFGENAKQAIERTTRRAREAADSYFNFVKKAITSLPSGGTDLGEELKSYAQTNIVATHEFVLKLSQAKDFQEVARIQSEFKKAQMEAFGEHTKLSPRNLQRQQQARVKRLPKTPNSARLLIFRFDPILNLTLALSQTVREGGTRRIDLKLPRR